MAALQKIDSSTSEDSLKKPKASLWTRIKDSKKPQPISDEDMEKYLGKNRAELSKWADSQPDVGRNQLAGKITVGAAPGLAGPATGAGLGGWGPGATKNDENRGMKFPPQKEEE